MGFKRCKHTMSVLKWPHKSIFFPLDIVFFLKSTKLYFGVILRSHRTADLHYFWYPGSGVVLDCIDS